MEESNVQLYRDILYRAWMLFDGWKSILAMSNIQELWSSRDPPPELQIKPADYENMRWTSIYLSYYVLTSSLLDFCLRVVKLKYGVFPIIWKLTEDHARTPIGRAMLFATIDTFVNAVIKATIRLVQPFTNSIILKNTPDSFKVLRKVYEEEISRVAVPCLLVPVLIYAHVHCIERFGVLSIAVGYPIICLTALAIDAVKIWCIDVRTEIVPLQEIKGKWDAVMELLEQEEYPQDRIFADTSDPECYLYYETSFYARAIVMTFSLIDNKEPRRNEFMPIKKIVDQSGITALVAHELGHFHYGTPYTTYYLEKVLNVVALGLCWPFAYGNLTVCSIFLLDPGVHPVIPLYCTVSYVGPLFSDLCKGICNLIKSQWIYAADNYAMALGYGDALWNALSRYASLTPPTSHKLPKELPILYCPSPWFSAWFTGHPPPIRRIENLTGGTD